MALWETQDPYPSHESEPFTHNQLNMTRSVVKQRRRGTRRTATTRSVERTKVRPRSKGLSSIPLSTIHHLPHITYRRSKSSPKIRLKHCEPLCAKATTTYTPSAAISKSLKSTFEHRRREYSFQSILQVWVRERQGSAFFAVW